MDAAVSYLPKDWVQVAVADAADVDPENLGASTNPSFEFNYVSLENCSHGRLEGFARHSFATAPSRARRIIHQGDFLYATVRPNLRGHHFFEIEGGVWIASTGFAVVRARPAICSPAYLAALLSSDLIQRQVDVLLTGSNYPAISSRDVRALKIALPPLPEQIAISSALSDASALVESLDALIAKKRNMLRGVRAQLLSGAIRLIGFGGPWQEDSFANRLINKSANGSLIKGRQSSAPLPGLFPGFSASGQDVWCEEAEFSGDGLVVSAVGSRCGKVFRATGAWTAIANTHVLLGVEGRVDVRYAWHILNDEEFWVKGGTGQPFVLMKESLKKVTTWPAVEEQTAIADVLDDLGNEIDALVLERDKAELIRQGMAQDLLSGKVRLV